MQDILIEENKKNSIQSNTQSYIDEIYFKDESVVFKNSIKRIHEKNKIDKKKRIDLRLEYLTTFSPLSLVISLVLVFLIGIMFSGFLYNIQSYKNMITVIVLVMIIAFFYLMLGSSYKTNFYKSEHN